MDEIIYFPEMKFRLVDEPSESGGDYIKRIVSGYTHTRHFHKGSWYRFQIRSKMIYDLPVKEMPPDYQIILHCQRYLLDDAYTYMILGDRIPEMMDLCHSDGGKAIIIDELQIDEAARIKSNFPKLINEK